MTTRKHQTPARKRARPGSAKRAATRSRASAPRGKTAPRAAQQDGALMLAAECTVAEADSLKAQLARRVDDPEAVIVDVSALQRIDTAGLQLLAAFVRDRRTAGRAVQWRGQASALQTAAGLLGLKDMLELTGEGGR